MESLVGGSLRGVIGRLQPGTPAIDTQTGKKSTRPKIFRNEFVPDSGISQTLANSTPAARSPPRNPQGCHFCLWRCGCSPPSVAEPLRRTGAEPCPPGLGLRLSSGALTPPSRLPATPRISGQSCDVTNLSPICCVSKLLSASGISGVFPPPCRRRIRCGPEPRRRGCKPRMR